MADNFYAKGAEKIWSGSINIGSDTIKAALVLSSYSLNLTTHEFLSDLGANTLGTAQTLTSKSVTGGMLDAADPTWTAPASGNTVKGIAIYKDTGSSATSPLLLWIDQITGFPFVTNGSDVSIQWNNGTYKIAGIS